MAVAEWNRVNAPPVRTASATASALTW
jgi:hypothetical protein